MTDSGKTDDRRKIIYLNEETPAMSTIFEMFSAPVGTYGNALLNWRSDSASEIVTYAAAYRSAAMSLVSLQERRGIGPIDHAALPILFLYRHSLELYLKSLVYRAAVLSINKQELQRALPRLWREHSLVSLVKMSAPVLHESSSRPLARSGELQEEMAGLAQILDDIDPGSYSFRYPVTTKGDSALPSHFFTNIFVFSEAMERAFDDLSQFCRHLEGEQLETSDQMKLALHELSAYAK
jgi:hypothetical protein